MTDHRAVMQQALDALTTHHNSKFERTALTENTKDGV